MSKAKRTVVLMLVTLSLMVVLLPANASLAVNSAKGAVKPGLASDSRLDFGISSQDLLFSDSGFSVLRKKDVDAFSRLRESSYSSTYSSVITWSAPEIETDDMKSPQLQTILRSAMLSINSFGPGKICVSAAMLSRHPVYKMGLASLRLQYYSGGRWMTVFGIGNSYVYNSESYYYSAIRSNMLSRGYYRVTATFLFTENNVTATMSRTTANIRCR